MLDFSNAEIKHLAIHNVGNKLTDDGVSFSNELIRLHDAYTPTLLLRYFLSPINYDEQYKFVSNPLHGSTVQESVKRIFDNPETLLSNSHNIGRHLYDLSVHPKISTGELYVCYFTGIIVNDRLVRAIGIFKSENKDTVFKINLLSDGSKMISYDDGINVNKLEKGCLIFDEQREDGYRVCVVDTQRGGAMYWKDFLSVASVRNDYSNTADYMTIVKNFISKQLPEDFEVSPADQIGLLNKASNYFKYKESFEQEDFEQSVFGESSLISSFTAFSNAYKDENDIEIDEVFDISPTAAKKHSKGFKRILKLDRNFHIYIHGDRELIEKHVDGDGRKYYVLYFDEES